MAQCHQLIRQIRFSQFSPSSPLNAPIRLSAEIDGGIVRLCQYRQRRQFAVYAVGEGWTGALGRKHLQRVILGHHDEEESETPEVIYPHAVRQASVGWGCTSLISSDSDDRGGGKLLIIGRPQDFVSLLRLNRLPRFVRRWSSQASTSAGDTSRTTVVGAMISSAIGWATGVNSNDDEKWESAEQQSNLHDWTEVSAPNESSFNQVVSSAGFSTVLGASGTIYSFGVNSRGQCGVGTTSNNIWTPQPVVGLSSTSKNKPASHMAEQEDPIASISLGLQHGLALSTSGKAYSWGKAGRGQLGRELSSDQDPEAKQIDLKSTLGVENTRPVVTQVASGMHHGALLLSDNRVLTWGKNCSEEKNASGQWEDVRVPRIVNGLPPSSKIEKISCGSHHTSILLDDGSVYAFGIAADVSVPVIEPVQLVPPGVIDMPCRHFEAHHDRTTIIGHNGQVFQVHLWNDEGLREYALFTPPWVDHIRDQGQDILSVHRGWLHTIIVTRDAKHQGNP